MITPSLPARRHVLATVTKYLGIETGLKRARLPLPDRESRELDPLAHRALHGYLKLHLTGTAGAGGCFRLGLPRHLITHRLNHCGASLLLRKADLSHL